jgi:hypothetical protein
MYRIVGEGREVYADIQSVHQTGAGLKSGRMCAFSPFCCKEWPKMAKFLPELCDPSSQSAP